MKLKGGRRRGLEERTRGEEERRAREESKEEREEREERGELHAREQAESKTVPLQFSVLEVGCLILRQATGPQTKRNVARMQHCNKRVNHKLWK